jgi:hypothetical protein
MPGQARVPTPPPMWEWNNNNAPIIQPTNSIFSPNSIPNISGLDAQGTMNTNTDTTNINMNGIGNGNGAMAMDSFFDHALFGGLTPTLGFGATTNESGNEDDIWTQLFGTFP